MKKAGRPSMYIDMFIMWSTALAQETMDKEDNTLSLIEKKTNFYCSIY